MIWSSNCWIRSSGEADAEERGGGAGSGRGEILLGMTCQVDHFGSIEEDISVLKLIM